MEKYDINIGYHSVVRNIGRTDRRRRLRSAGFVEIIVC